MSLIVALIIATATPQTGAGITYKNVAYGPSKLMICDWFWNFENSRFDRCRTEDGRLVTIEDGASIDCLRRSCEQLDAQARRVANWKKAEPVWGEFSVRLYGRVSAQQRPKRYLGDGTRTVLIEKLVSVRKR